MFGSLLGGKFSNKCKHGVKCIRSRIGLIRKKKQAMIKYLRRDVAELLSSGHDNNAFGRIEALIVEINYASCYDTIELYCEYILQLLPSLQKQRECPEEAMEAISTLIFAAARFSDLPELCDLRTLFTERYGSEMESSTNGEFVEKVQKKSFSMEKRLQLMQHIAEEVSVPWDYKAFQQKLYNQQRPHAENWRNAAIKGRKERIVDVGGGGDREAPSKERWEPPPRNLVQKELVQPEHRDIRSKLRSENNDQLSHAENNRRNAATEGRKEAAIIAGGNRLVPSDDRWEPPSRSLVRKDEVQPKHQGIQPKLRSENNEHRSHAENWRNTAIKGRKEAATDAVGDREDPSYDRREPPPRSLVWKEQLQPEPRDIHVIPSISNDRRHDPAERKRNKVHAACCTDGKVLPLVKPKGRQNGTHKDVSPDDRTAGNRSLMTREGPGLVGPENAKVIPSVKPKDNQKAHKDDYFDEAIAESRSSIAWEEPGLIGLEKPIVASVISRDVKAVNMVPPYTKLNGVKNETRARDHVAAYGELPKAEERKDPIAPESWCPSKTPNANDARLINRLPPYTKPSFRQVAGEELGGAVVRDQQHASRPRREHRKHGSRRSAATCDRERDEEEQAMDRLLVHFSKKGTSKMRTRTRDPAAELVVDTNRAGERQRHHNNDDGRVCPGPTEPAHRRPDRVASLPSEPSTPVPLSGAGKGAGRATSMRPGMLSPREGLVHPNLPDYDELAARFIALRKA